VRRATLPLLAILVCVAALLSAQTPPGKTLDIYFIDTEGGQSTLFVSPTGESLLVDTGNRGERDLERILAAITAAGVKQIDHLWTTHYHGDHVGGMEELAKRVPIRRFYDHGPPSPNDRATPATFIAMYEALSAGKRTVVKPGDTVPMAGIDITTVSSNAAAIKTNLPGAGTQNPACAGVNKKDESAYTDPDNGASAGFALAFGKFRLIDLGDLTWNGELDLMCPLNRVGKVDVFVVSHHGQDTSNSPALVHGLQPRAAIMNNGTRKGGALATFKVLETSPSLEDLWQLHWSHNVGVEHNAPGAFIANIDDNETIAAVLTTPAARGRGGAAAAHTPAYWLKLSAERNGTFTIANPRNGFSKTYRPGN
jgi:beta-lactamase superfamily II metal-dependent hydrolase